MTTFMSDFEDLKNFEFGFQRLNVEKVADEAFEDAIKQDFIGLLISNIKKRGLVGSGVDDGTGPDLASRKAWNVIREGNMRYRIETERSVGPRAFYLEYGTDEVTPDGDGPLRFRTNVSTYDAEPGEIIYRYSVSGVEEYRYFRDTVQEFNKVVADKVEERIGDKMTDHIERQLKLG